MKTPNSVAQKIRILHKINKKGYFKQKCQASEKYVHFYALNTWLGLLLHELLHQCRFSMGFRSGEFAGQSSTVTPWSLNQLLVPLAVWAGAKSCWKMKSASP